MQDETRRLGRLEVGLEFLADLCRAGERCFAVTGNPLPDDARALRARVREDGAGAVVELVLESAAFSPVLAGEVIPLLPPLTFTRRERPAAA